MFKKKKKFEKDLMTNKVMTNAIAKISADLSNTRIKDLSIRLDKFLVKDCNFLEVIASGKHDGTIKLDYTTRNFRKRKQKDIKLRADVIFTGRNNNLYKIEVEIYVSAFCVNNTYDDLMKDYAYSYMRDLLGSSEELTKLGFNENFLVDINKDEFQKDRFDGFVESIEVNVHMKNGETEINYYREEPESMKEPTEDEIREDENNRAVIAYFDKHKADEKERQMYLQALEDGRRKEMYLQSVENAKKSKEIMRKKKRKKDKNEVKS